MFSRSVWVVGLALVPLLGWMTFARTDEPSRTLRITHGPMLGRPGAHQMGIWARTSRSGRFRVRYGTEPGRLDSSSNPVDTTSTHDNTGYVILEDLKADTKYHYEVFAEGNTKGIRGTFRTWPDAEDYRHPELNPKGLFNFQFEFACGNNQGVQSLGPKLPTFATMLRKIKDKVHFAILNGDWLYEDDRDFSVKQWQKQVDIGPKQIPSQLKLTPTITGVWQNYKTYLERGKNLSLWHRHVPTYYTLDDHEILNDVEGCGQTGFRERRTVFRDIAIQAWVEYLAWSNPTRFRQQAHFGKAKLRAKSDVLFDPKTDFTKLDFEELANLHIHWGTPDAGVDDRELDKKKNGDPNAGVYEIVQVIDKHRLQVRPPMRKTGEAVYSIGRRNYYRVQVSNCDFYFLDTRSHRQKHDIKNPAKKGMTLLGMRQRKWLMDNMANSKADFFFVVSSVNFVIPHVGAGGMAFAAADKDDAWTVFLDERKTLLDFWDKMKTPVLVLTGDLHNSFAIKITDNVWEFASGPHNSRNHPASSEGNRPATGVFNSRGRKCDVRWSTYFRNDTPLKLRHQPVYCVVQVNNVINNPLEKDKPRWVAYPQPQVIFRYYDGFEGDLLYAEAIYSKPRRQKQGKKHKSTK